MEGVFAFHDGKRCFIIVVHNNNKSKAHGKYSILTRVTSSTSYDYRIHASNRAKDYRDFRDVLTEMDRILIESGIEDEFVNRHLGSSTKGMSDRKRVFRSKTIRKALRHSILLSMTKLSVREFATRLADSRLFQWFTSSEQIDAVRPGAKSTVERFEKMFTDGEIEQLIHDLNRMATNPEKARTILRLEKPLTVENVFADSTCVEANIHFPTDWVLLRDAVRTLTKAVSLIRA